MTEDHFPPPLDPARHALFLDFDGTLVDFAPEPDAISLRAETLPLLKASSLALGGALAIVTGRRIADLDRYLAPPEFPAVGVHGQEFRPIPGEIHRLPPPEGLDIARWRLAAALAPADPVRLEDKESALVLHYRAHPDQMARAGVLARNAAGGLPQLNVVGGDGIFEILDGGTTKARALDLFLQRQPFAGRVPVFVGDDVVDEEGIRAAAAEGGFGIKVGPGETAALYRLSDISAVHDWLARLADPGALAGTMGSTRR
jgi:trehalose 6-phosphate phosphatase